MIFKFLSIDDSGTSEVTFEADTHSEVTNRYIDFLRGNGFNLKRAKGNCNYDINDLIELDNLIHEKDQET